MKEKKEIKIDKEMIKAIKEAKDDPKARKCKLVLCVDPTGKEKPTMRPEGECPEGYMEKVAIEVKKKGLAFEL